jgi:hypothetical protein
MFTIAGMFILLSEGRLHADTQNGRYNQMQGTNLTSLNINSYEQCDQSDH